MDKKSLGLKVRMMAILKKNAVKCLSAMFMMICICGIGTDITYAEDFSYAREIQINRDVDDSVIHGYDYHQNYYKFTAPQSGYVTIHFSNPMQRNAEEFWKVTLYSSQYNELYSGSVYGNQTNTDLITVGIPSGSYYIKVTSAASWEAKSKDRYTLRANFTQSDTWEKEPNDNYVSATPMDLNTDYCGTIRNGSDTEKDYYRLTINEPGCLDVIFSSFQQKNQEAYWKVRLYNSSYEEICNTTVYGNQRYTYLPSIGLGRGNYYIKVTSAVWSEALSTDVYTVRASFRPSDVWEKELNEDFTTATEIELNKSYFGTTNDGTEYEKDFYKFNAITSGNYRIQMKVPNLRDYSAYWKLYVYDSSYTQLACIDIFGNQTLQYVEKALPAGTNYVHVESIYWNETRSTEVYELSVMKLGANGQPETPTQPTMPTQPTVPTQPVAPTNPVLPTQPTVPTQPVTPTNPVLPTQPSEPQDEYYSVEWNVPSATLQVGQSTDALIAEVTGDDEIELYTSSNTAVVTVESNGVINARKAGSAAVRVITKHGSVAILNIRVQKNAVTTKSITVDTKNVSLQEGETYELDAELSPITSSQGIRYTSVNSKIASVSKDGLIKGKKKGTTTIKVKSGKITVKVKVIVQ